MSIYISKKPTKEKRNLFNVLEKYKSHGTVPVEKINKYIAKKGFLVDTSPSGDRFSVYNKRKTLLVAGGINKKNRINMWAVR